MFRHASFVKCHVRVKVTWLSFLFMFPINSSYHFLIIIKSIFVIPVFFSREFLLDVSIFQILTSLCLVSVKVFWHTFPIMYHITAINKQLELKNFRRLGFMEKLFLFICPLIVVLTLSLFHLWRYWASLISTEKFRYDTKSFQCPVRLLCHMFHIFSTTLLDLCLIDIDVANMNLTCVQTTCSFVT